MADHMRVRHLALSIERWYVGWARRLILFHNKRHPREMGRAELGAFLASCFGIDLLTSQSRRLARRILGLLATQAARPL